MPCGLTRNHTKKSSFWSVTFSCSTPTTNHFSIRLKKLSFYMTTGKDQLSGWTEKLHITSQSQSCTREKVMATVWWSAAWLIHYSFLNPGKIITSEKYVQQMMRCTKNCNARSWYWSTQRAQFFSTTSNRMSHNTSKVEQIGLQSFASSIIFTWPLTKRLPLQASWELFAGKNASTTRRHKMLSMSSLNPEARIFMLQE